MKINSTELALSRGYTLATYAECSEYALEGLIRPDDDRDGIIQMYVPAERRCYRLNGWLWNFEPA